MADIQRILRERDTLWALMEPWREDWQQITDLALPGQSDILRFIQPGQRRTRRLYDHTMMWALDTFVGHLSAWVSNFQTQFFRLRMRALRDIQEAAKWLDNSAETMWHNMVANEAPQPTAINESYRFYAGLGTGAMFLGEREMDEANPQLGFRGWQAVSMAPGTYAMAENAAGRVDTMYREFHYTPQQAAERWNISSLHPNMQDALSEGERSDRRFIAARFLHAVYPRRVRDPRRRDNLNMPWESVYIDLDNKHEVRVGGFDWFPYIVFRWDKLVTHNPFGFGRGHLALPESRTLQVIDRDMLVALSQYIQPSGWLVGASRETARNSILMPGRLNPLAAGGNFVPYQSGSRVDAAMLQINERRERILRAFFIDQLQFLPPVDQRTARTLGELQLRARQMMRIMGPYMQRLIPEFLNPFVDINFNTNLMAGEFDPPPDVILEAAQTGTGQIDVEYTGDLSRAQRDGEADAIIEGMDFLLNVAAQSGDPMVLRNVALDDSVAEFLRARGFPESQITDRRLMAQIREEAQRAQENAAQTQQDLAESEMMRNAAPVMQAVERVAA